MVPLGACGDDGGGSDETTSGPSSSSGEEESSSSGSSSSESSESGSSSESSESGSSSGSSEESSSSDGADSSSSDSGGGAGFQCGEQLICAPESEYCQRQVSDVQGVPDSYQCLPLPEACDNQISCDCLDGEPCARFDLCEETQDGGVILSCPGG